MRRVRAHTVRFEHLLRISVIGRVQCHTAFRRHCPNYYSQTFIGGFDRFDNRRNGARVTDHVRVRKVDNGKGVAVGVERIDEPVGNLLRGHLWLVVVRRNVAR